MFLFFDQELNVKFGWETANKMKVEPMVKNKMGVQIAKTYSGAK